MLNVEVFKALVPKNQKSVITEEFVNKINSWSDNPVLMDCVRENMLSYVGVLQQGKYKIADYVNAVKFVSYRLLGHSNIDSYIITFPDRYKILSDKGLDRSDVSNYVNAYSKNKLVVAVYEQTIMPSHVINAPMHQNALNELATIMVKSKSDIARVNAANSILTHTKPPENTKIELDIGIKGTDVIKELRMATEELAIAQLQSIQAGRAVKEIAESTIITVKAETVD